MNHQHGISPTPYFDRTFSRNAMRILPGGYLVSASGMMLMTVLGSCVAVCIQDPVAGIGGMNHFMMPGTSRQPDSTGRYGQPAMEMLLDDLIRQGGVLSRCRAKIFGAGRVIPDMSDIGRKNVEFALAFLSEHAIHVAAVDTGDIFPRKVYFNPATGQVFVKRLLQASPDDGLIPTPTQLHWELPCQ